MQAYSFDNGMVKILPTEKVVQDLPPHAFVWLTLSPDELINPVSTLSGKAPIKKKTTHWYLPLGKHEEFLREWILKEHKDDWRATVVGQCKSWIEGGLQSRAVTRDLDWGIKVPASLNPSKGGTLVSDILKC